MQEWTYRHDVARVDNAGVEISAPCGRGGHCGSGLIRSGQSENARTQVALLAETDFLAGVDSLLYKKLSYRRGTARCVVSIEILPIATQQCRNYLYDKS